MITILKACSSEDYSSMHTSLNRASYDRYLDAQKSYDKESRTFKLYSENYKGRETLKYDLRWMDYEVQQWRYTCQYDRRYDDTHLAAVYVPDCVDVVKLICFKVVKGDEPNGDQIPVEIAIWNRETYRHSLGELLAQSNTIPEYIDTPDTYTRRWVPLPIIYSKGIRYTRVELIKPFLNSIVSDNFLTRLVFPCETTVILEDIEAYSKVDDIAKKWNMDKRLTAAVSHPDHKFAEFDYSWADGTSEIILS